MKPPKNRIQTSQRVNREYGESDLLQIMHLQESGDDRHIVAAMTYGAELLNWAENNIHGDMDDQPTLIDLISCNVSWGDFDTRSPRYFESQDTTIAKTKLTPSQTYELKQAIQDSPIAKKEIAGHAKTPNLGKILRCQQHINEEQGRRLYELLNDKRAQFLIDPETYRTTPAIFDET